MPSNLEWCCLRGKGTIGLLLVLALFFSGCVGETLYVCPTGEKVSDSNLCPKETPSPSPKTIVEKEYVCQNGEVVSDPSSCSIETTPPTSTTSTTTSTVSTASSSSTTITTTSTTSLSVLSTTSSTFTTTTIPPQAPSPSIELVWEFKEPESESNLYDSDVVSVSVSDDNKNIGVYFGGGTNYILDETGGLVWSAKFEGSIEYSLYRYNAISSYNLLTFTGPYNAFKLLSNGNVILISDKIGIRNNQNQPVGESYRPKTEYTDKYVGLSEADLSEDGKYAAVASFDDLSIHLVELSEDSIDELWGYKTRGFAFYDPAVSEVPTVVAAQTDGWIGFFNQEGKLLWNENFDTFFTGIDISSDGRCIVAVDDKMNLYLLDNDGNTLLKELLDGNLEDVAISSDCGYLVVGVDDTLKKYSINLFQDASNDLEALRERPA